MSDKTPSEFVVTVEGIGTFTFGWRTMRRQMSIEVEFARLTEGVLDVHPFLMNMANAMADLKVLVLDAPPGWDVDELDAGDDESFDKLMKVWGALLKEERTFRGGQPGGQGGRSADGEVDGVLVSPPVQSAA